jgi:asparagine synthase (glutamine-hydrolysing)
VCGIGGILTFDGGEPARADLKRMADALKHRGPDAEGFFSEGGVPGIGLAHRRLSIVDLRREADHPVTGEDRTVQALLNGEVYNYRALRAGLESTHTFRTLGDTEPVVHGYEDRGDAIFAELDGMFALALWDGRRRRLVLARDAFGKKPLYYWHDARRFVFASEIKGLLAAGVPVALDETRLGESLAFGYVPTPRTLFAGIRKVPPASILVIDKDGVHEPRQFWDLSFPPAGEALAVSLEEAAERVRELFVAAVKKRLMGDVPLGVLLSGGVDSSAVAAVAAREGASTLKTFTMGFEGDAFFDERPWAAQVARHLGAEHHQAVAAPHAAELMETLLHHHDEPFGDSSALPTYLVAREARRHVTVALNGDGGDETFAGYDRFRAVLISESLPGPARAALAALGRAMPGAGGTQGLLRRARRFARKAALPFDERVFSWTAFFDLDALRAIDGDALADRDRILASYRETLARAEGASVLGRVLYLNARTYLLDDLLPKMDRMTMAHGLEARSPLLDRDLMEYVARLPDDFKRKGGRSKIVFKRAVAPLLPAEILGRPKHGFGVPLGAWFRGELRGMAEDTLLENPRIGRCVRREGLESMLRDHARGAADHGHKLWTLLTHELWLRKHRLAC